jgi:hypothetical protein
MVRVPETPIGLHLAPYYGLKVTSQKIPQKQLVSADLLAAETPYGSFEQSRALEAT